MKIERIKTVLILVLVFAIAFVMISGDARNLSLHPESIALAQSASPRQDLVSRMRLDVDNFQNAMEDFQTASHVKTDSNITFVAGDMAGNNSGVAAADLTQAVADFTTIYNAIRSGGTISVGVWTNVTKVR